MGQPIVSVIIPARNEQHLEKTIRNVLANARGDVEVLTVLDGWLPEPKIDIGDERAIFFHFPESIGQRAAINYAAGKACGEFVMKLDAHCAVDEGFDVKLAADCEHDWTVIPRMYNLDVATWLPKKHKRTDYMYIGLRPNGELRTEYYGGQEFRRQHRKPDLIDDTMSCMGPCFFMRKDRFWELGGCDENHGGWGQQGIEVACKAWLSGGRLVVNKKTWFSHWFRGGSGPGFPYKISGHDVGNARKYSKSLWLEDKWPLAKRKFQWMLDKFKPPGWGDRQMTVIYYSSNYESDRFESEVVKVLLEHSKSIPVVSVTQKPMSLGKNICVGDIGRSDYNVKKQLLMGAKEATTKFVCVAESDFLYPPDYFKFIPPKDDRFYFWGNIFVIWTKKNAFYPRHGVEGAMVCNREFLIQKLEEQMAEYDRTGRFSWGAVTRLPFAEQIPSEFAAVTFKTGRGMSNRCPHDKEHRLSELPLWGSARKLNRRYRGE